ncbi:7391_t:CDS:2, partial [Paraglomus occultum]
LDQARPGIWYWRIKLTENHSVFGFFFINIGYLVVPHDSHQQACIVSRSGLDFVRKCSNIGEMEPSYDETTDFNYDLDDPALDFDENIHLDGLIGNPEFVPLFDIGITIVVIEAITKAFVVFEHEGVRHHIWIDLPTVDEIMRRRPRKTNGFLYSRTAFSEH